jgi:arachidonate 15-lipoxygenase
MSSFLPQHDPDPETREEKTSSAQEEYEYSYDHVPTLAMVKKVPHQEKFAYLWWLKIFWRVHQVLRNELHSKTSTWWKPMKDEVSLMYSVRGAEGFQDVVTQVACRLAEDDEGPDDVPSLEHYEDLYRKISLPQIAGNFRDDKVFAYMRIAGPNPVLLKRIEKRVDRFPVSEDIFQSVMPDDSMEAARKEGRLFLADYALLEGIEDGSFPDKRKFLYAPLALFAVDKVSKDLMPIAIQSEQTPGEDNPIITPRDDPYNWLIAKTIVGVADANYHEAITHLGRTHLFVEPFVLATRRQLAPNHPLSRLLCPHFQGTLAINNAAHEKLIADKSDLDKIIAGTMKSTREAVVAGVSSYRIDDAMIPNAFRSRGVDDTVLSVYPYRDDSRLYWEAIKKWVSDYLKIWYHTQTDLEADHELSNWYNELRAQDGGRVGGFRDGELDIEYLVDITTLVIFTASVQHAAVNFPQADLMAYCPNMPLACYSRRPRRKRGANETDYLNMLPPIQKAREQLRLGYILGSVNYTKLGSYPWRYFRDSRVKAPLKAFQIKVKEIDSRIKDRNLKRPPYKYLLAAGIPRSINI